MEKIKTIWNWFILKGFELGLVRGRYFWGTRDEAFFAVRKMLGVQKTIDAIKLSVDDIKIVKLK